MKNEHEKHVGENGPQILPGNDAGQLTGSAPQQGVPVGGLQAELAANEDHNTEDSQKRQPVKAEEKEKLQEKEQQQKK